MPNRQKPPSRPPSAKPPKSRFAISIRAQVGRGERSKTHDSITATPTDVDPESTGNRKRIRRRRSRSRDDSRSEVTPIHDEAPTGDLPPVPQPVAPARLSELRVTETLGRRGVNAVPKAPVTAEPSEAGAPALRIGWVRSEDAEQKLVPYKKHGFVVAGVASGKHGSGVRRPPAMGGGFPAAPAVPPALAIGVEGTIYTVRVRGGESARASAEQLAARLSLRFEVRVETLADGRTLVRLTGEREGASEAPRSGAHRVRTRSDRSDD